MDTRSQHLLAEYYGCAPDLLNDLPRLEKLMQRAAVHANTRVLQTVMHRFHPQGVSGVVIIEESHLSIHTWPETGYAAVDFYTCGAGIPERAHVFLMRELKAARAELMVVERGLGDGRSLRLKAHREDLPGQASRPFEEVEQA